MSVGSAAPTGGRRRSTRDRRPGFIEPRGSLLLASARAANAAISGSMPSTLTLRIVRQRPAAAATFPFHRDVDSSGGSIRSSKDVPLKDGPFLSNPFCTLAMECYGGKAAVLNPEHLQPTSSDLGDGRNSTQGAGAALEVLRWRNFGPARSTHP
jgi:hypothetical protein